MKLLIIDNYDSFTYNLLHYMQELTDDVSVFRNDAITIEAINNYDAFIISPGPGLPEQAGICLEAIKTYYKTKKILGVCLGHQAIAVAFGSRLKNLSTVLHGVERPTFISQPADSLYRNLPAAINCGRYHSWVVDKASFPDELIVTAFDAADEIMSLRHRVYDVRGVQFHPESVMTEYGKLMLENWLKG